MSWVRARSLCAAEAWVCRGPAGAEAGGLARPEMGRSAQRTKGTNAMDWKSSHQRESSGTGVMLFFSHPFKSGPAPVGWEFRDWTQDRLPQVPGSGLGEGNSRNRKESGWDGRV